MYLYLLQSLQLPNFTYTSSVYRNEKLLLNSIETQVEYLGAESAVLKLRRIHRIKQQRQLYVVLEQHDIVTQIGLPNLKYGAGLVWKIQNSPVLILPIRDEEAPVDPARIDCQTGKVEDEGPVSAQIREGTEETVIVRERDEKVELGIPTLIEDTKFEESLKYYYEGARCDDSSPLPDYDSTFYYESSVCLPQGLPEKSLNSEYKTGYLMNFENNTVTEELLNQMTVGLDLSDLISGDYNVYDIENMKYPEYKHFDRPVLFLNYENGECSAYKSGDLMYQCHVSEFKQFLKSDMDWEVDDEISTCKVQGILHCLECSESVDNELVHDEYINRLESVGDSIVEY